jgi:hypothetical protein
MVSADKHTPMPEAIIVIFFYINDGQYITYRNEFL